MGRLGRNLAGVPVKVCARLLGISDTAIHKAIKAGRCSKLPDGSVDIEAIRAGMALTADPLRGGKRQAGVFGSVQHEAAVTLNDELPFMQHEATPPSTQSAEPMESSRGHRPLLEARTLTEQTRAERELIELAKLKGTVTEIGPMTKGVHDAMVAARSELLSLPDRLTPMVTPEQDPRKVFDLIEAEVQRVCATLQNKLAQMAASTGVKI